jgi:hypothetical protein
MQELIKKIEQEGLTEDQAVASLYTIINWVEEKYPIAGSVAKAWVKNNTVRQAPAVVNAT